MRNIQRLALCFAWVSVLAINPLVLTPGFGATEADVSFAALDPQLENNWDLTKASHLLRRTSFGATRSEIQESLSKGFQATVTDLLTFKDTSELEAALLAQNYVLTGERPNFGDLQRWWLYRMQYSPNPFQEKLTLFWHNHFATAYSKVRDIPALQNQNKLFRRNALGNFRTMLVEVSKDPAMILWLDNNTNRKGRPNENYARELMELFTMGIGNYSEQDVKEAARAFTGWQTNNGQFIFNSREHDNDPKTFLGRTGNFNGEDIIDIILEQPVTARFVARKFWVFFGYENPDPALIDSLAEAFRNSSYDIAVLVRAMLSSSEFYSERAFLAQVKNPVELVIGTLRMLGARSDHRDLTGPLTRMGMSLFNPPDVSGWDGNAAWINTSTLMERYNFVNRLVTNRNAASTSSYFDLNAGLSSLASLTHVGFADYFLDLLAPLAVPSAMRIMILNYMSPPPAAVANLQESAQPQSGNTLDGTTLLSLRKGLMKTRPSPIPTVTPVPLSPSMIDQKGRGALYLIMTLPSYQLN
ncbi:MAG: DUF1800 domain-containing protein [Acidobacteriota bacterium]